MANETQIMPHFVEVRGCINCDVSKKMKERTGKPYGFDHELMAGCLLFGCQNFGVSLMKPMIDPDELLEIIKLQKLNDQQKANVIKYLQALDDLVGEYYEKVGVDIQEIITKIE